MIDKELISEILRFVAETGEDGPQYVMPVPGMHLLCNTEPTPLVAQIYDPVICLILQGRKEAHLSGRSLSLGAGDSVIVSHNLPVIAAVTEASRETPYIALIQEIDLGVIRALENELDVSAAQSEGVQGLMSGATNPLLIEAMVRMFRASMIPADAQALAPLIHREIHFRLLQANHGAMLRQMLNDDSAASRIGRVVALLRSEFARPFAVADMADLAGMSVSSFHTHFKAITQTSPLQYQKELRLIEARRLLLETSMPISTIAFEVGYESATQFSREYSRKYGRSPRQDLTRARAA